MALMRLVIDGEHFSTLDEFFEEVSRVLIPNVYWGRNLNAFNDILRGGFGTPDEGFILIWRNSELSRDRLGDEQFRDILEIIQLHCPGGRESDDGLRLILE